MFLWLNQLIIIDHHAGQSVETSIRYSCSRFSRCSDGKPRCKKVFFGKFLTGKRNGNKTEIFFVGQTLPTPDRPLFLYASTYRRASTHDTTPYTKRYYTERLSIFHISSIRNVSAQHIIVETLETR